MGPECHAVPAGTRSFRREAMTGHDSNCGLPATNQCGPSQEGKPREFQMRPGPKACHPEH